MVNVKVCGCLTYPRLSAPTLWMTVCGVVKVGVNCDIGATGVAPSVISSRVFQSGMSRPSVELQGDVNPMHRAGVFDADQDFDHPLCLSVLDGLQLCRGQGRGIRVQESSTGMVMSYLSMAPSASIGLSTAST